MFGFNQKGLSLSSIVQLFEQRPAQHDMILFIAKRLWVVIEVSVENCKLQELIGLELSDTYWDTTDPNPTNYWFVPVIQGRIVYPKLPESSF